MAAVHSILPPPLTEIVDRVLTAAGVAHVAHGDMDPTVGAIAAIADPQARIVIGPFRSRAVADAVEVTASAGLDAQLAHFGMPRADVVDADVIVLAGLAGHEEIHRARALAPMPIIAFDGIQPELFPNQRVSIALVYSRTEDGFGSPETRRAAELAVSALECGDDTLSALRRLGPFDEHGDLVDPLVRFEVY
jgi:hypothetical protein